MAFDIPILFLVFNRPETTAQVFQRIKEIRPVQLFVAADGPRTGKEEEKEKCDEVRRLILNNIDWPCDIKTLFRDHNLGCGNAVNGAITWFFQNVKEGIILEDDTLPDLSFFEFCKKLLEKYRHDDEIKMISGNNFQEGKWRGDGSYYFSAYSHIWGWATWKRTWNEYDFTMNRLDADIFTKCLHQYFDKKLVFDYWRNVFQQMKDLTINTWDYQLLFSIWRVNGISIVPNQNLVSNIGFGASSTHTQNKEDKTSKMAVTPLNNVRHPKKIGIDKEADWFYFKNYLQSTPGMLQRIKNRLLRIS